MSTRRGARALLSAMVLAACLSIAPVARAQQSDVLLRLVEQTPWTTRSRPLLRITFDAINSGPHQLNDLAVELTLGPAVRARLVYEESLTQGPGDFPIYGPVATRQDGTLDPGQTRRFTVSVDVRKVAGVSQTDSLVYPVEVALRSGGLVVAALNTAEIQFVRTLEPPLLLSWWAELAAPIAMDPSGRLADGDFETSVAPGGSLRSEAEALRDLSATSPRQTLHLAVEPAVLDQLSRMTAGYQRSFASPVAPGEGGAADAAAILSDLRAAVDGRSAQVSAMPFSAPALPSLMQGGLARDLSRQTALAALTVSTTLGVVADATVMRPPGGALDGSSLQALASRGVRTLLGDADTVARPPQVNDFAPPPTALLQATASPVEVVLPDPHVSALLQNQALLSDPVRASQALLGELAAIWREQPVPVPPAVRGVALGLPADIPAGLWGPLLQRIGGAPFLRTLQPGKLAATVNPPAAQAVLRSPGTDSFSRDYELALHTEHDNTAAYRSMLFAPNPLPDRMERDLLYAEAGQYVGDEIHGRAWYDEVHATLTGIFARTAPDTSQVFTFTSSAGTIPIRMGDPGSTPLRMIVLLRSSRFTFPNGEAQVVTLSKARQIVLFRVEAAASGQGTIQVFIRSPSGLIVSQEALLVRSTGVNKIAIIITVVAGVGLAALWSRRLFRRRTP